MKKQDLIKAMVKAIEEKENAIFYVEMIDHWTNKDREIYEELSKEIKNLQSQLEEIKKTINSK